MQDGDNGKKKVVKLGMAPEQRSGIEYEFTVFLDIASDSLATASKDRTDLFSTVNAAGGLDKRSFIITPETGKELLSWLDTGAEPPPPEPTLAEKITELYKVVELGDNPQDTWIKSNIDNLGKLDDDKLQKIYDYLNNVKKENDNG